ncbi:Nuclear receptor corepressor 1 [Sesamum alatum]|uniref:Nuclear receptor corepressor 1 n=1 Tax=Sesamum alatum TaxID=300844 RepID=A0AAE2CQL6_9LAMI|nr:Nuclear receptor corepressor 1 [Sesamum alatum]
MPPEPLPWDRRDFRKHERSGSDPRLGGGGFGGGGPHRWREQHHHPHAPPPHPPPYQHHHQQQQRWYSDFRSSRPLPPGHGKQGGWHMYPDDAGHGFLPFGSRYADRNLEDENCRPFGSRGDGRYFRNSRENRGSFAQKDWKAPAWEAAASPNGPGRPTTEVNNLRSIENTQTCHDSSSSKSCDASQPPSNSANLSNQSQSLVKEKNDKNVSTADGRTSSDQNTEKENCLGSTDWKPLKWTRSGSLTSRGSGFSHSSCSKTMGVDSTETVAEVQLKNATPIQSPSAEAAACVISTALAQSDETGSRKKPRLGWGEGLAKYEKKKVEGPEDDATKTELVLNVSNTESMQSPAVNLSEKSPTAPSLSYCASPATPSSVACSSSPGIEEKESMKDANVNHDATNLSSSPSIVSQTHYDGPNFNLENLELASIVNLSSLINELLQSDDPSSAETGYVRTTSINKLLVWKVDILKAIEITESEIDSLETKLKSLIAESGGYCPHPADSSSLSEGCQLKPCEGLVTASTFGIRPAPLQIVSSGEMIVEDVSVALEDEHALSKDEDVDSPGSATSKLVEVLPAGEDIFPSETAENTEGYVNQHEKNSSNLDENRLSDEGNSGCVDNHVLNGTTRCEDLASVSAVHYDVDDNHDIYGPIFSSNKDCATRALEELNKLLPAERCLFDAFAASSFSSLQRDSALVKKKFLTRKRFLRFKENVLTLRFKVFQHFWKEGRLVSTRKLRLKTQKKFDPSFSGHRKNRSTSRSRIASYGGGPQTVPADEVIAFVNGLLSESASKPYRNTLKMPALILDKGMKMTRFISKNGLVEDPCAVEKERSMINPWSPEEKEIFIDKLAAFGKDFRKISSFLDHKTVADCIEFYYKNHKSECFEKTRKNPDFMKQRKSQSTTYLVGSGKRWNRESNAASLDMLGAASEIAANVNDTVEIQQSTSKFCFGASTSYKDPKGGDGPLRRSNSLDMYNNKRETVAADVLAGICGSVSSEAISSCITSSVDPGDGYHDWRYPRVGSSMKRPLTPEVTQNVDDECSDESCGELDPTDWTDEEKSIFIHAVASYGKDFLKISECVRTRSIDQCKVFFSKARKCLGLDLIQPEAGNAASGDVNGDGSDIEDGCTTETGTVNNASECEMEEDEDLPPPDMKSNHESDIVGARNLRPDLKMSEKNNGLDSLDRMAAEPALKNSLTGDSQVDDKPDTDFTVENKEQNGADVGFVSLQECETTVASSNMKSGQRVEEGDDLHLPKGLSEAEKKALVEVSDGHCGKENQQRLPSPRANLDNKTVEDRDANSGDVSNMSGAISEIKSEPQPVGDVCHSSFDAHSSMQVDKVSGYQKKAAIETCSAEKSCVSSLQQNGHLASVKSSTMFSVPVEYRNSPNCKNASLDVGADMHSENIVRTCDRQQLLSVSSLSDTLESQIPRTHLASMQTMKEISGNVKCKKQYPLHNMPKKDGDLQSGRHANFFLEKCNSSTQQNNVGEALFPSLEPSRDHPKPQAGCSSDVDKSSRKGDVKLFGKILISSQQKPNSCAQEADQSNSQDRKGVQSLNLKLSSDQKVNFDSAHSKFDCNNYVGSETIPVTSFGFWDGNRIQTGYPPLPDSALLLTKYPAAFHSGVMPPPLHGVIRSNDCSSNGVSVFPSREASSSNGLADYQVLRNRDLQPFTIDMKQPQDAFTEMQRRNRFDLVPGMQQQARGMLGINVVGRGGVLVGGQCSGVSDPVAAIRMHYAKAGQLSLQAGNVIKEDDRWRSNGGL